MPMWGWVVSVVLILLAVFAVAGVAIVYSFTRLVSDVIDEVIKG